MGIFPALAILFALVIGLPVASLSAVRERSSDGTPLGAFVVNLIAIVTVLFFTDWLIILFGRPMTTFGGLVPILFIDILIALILSAVVDVALEGFSGGPVVAVIMTVVVGIVWIVGYNSGHSQYKATHVVSTTVEPGDALPPSSTDHMVVVSSEIATTKANQAMSTGIGGSRNYSTYLDLGPATLQMIDGGMQYVFPLKFDGAGNKRRLHAIMPGYIQVSAEDPNAAPVERYDNVYSMKVGFGAGQGAQPVRWAYDHGYHSYLLDDPTLEINDQGLPFYTITLLKPHLGWTFAAPVATLVIDAHTGKITRYNLKNVPQWVDRVYGQQMSENIANWYGHYAKAGFKGPGSSNANRYKVSGDPVLVYTGGGHPDWRMLLTSFNKDTAVSKIVIMDAHTGAMRIYTPQKPMGIEDPVYQAFDSASGQGAAMVKANHYKSVGLTLHVIYGHLTWMATYKPEGTSPSFVGVGFVDAYHATANNVVFGNSKSAALQNYLTQLASEGSSNGNAPGAGGQYQTFTGKIAASGVQWDITGGQKYYYISLVGDNQHAYVGTVNSVGPALVLARPGDSVTIRVLTVGTTESTRTMQSFTDARVPLKLPGS